MLSRDASGRESAQEFLQPIHSEGLRALAETVLDFLVPLNPRTTDDVEVYSYNDPARGSGTLRLEGSFPDDLGVVHDVVTVRQVSDAIGEHDPQRPEEQGFGIAIVPRIINPFFYLLIAFCLFGASIAMVVTPFTPSTPTPSSASLIVSFVLAAMFIALGIFFVLIGIKRLGWWRRARAKARRQGVPLPDQLKVWS